MKARLWHWVLGSITGAAVAVGLFALLWAARRDTEAAAWLANTETWLLAVVLGAFSGGLGAVLISALSRRPVVAMPSAPVVDPRPMEPPAPVPQPAKTAPPLRRQTPFLSRLHVARISPELTWVKLSKSLQKLLDTSAKKLRGVSILDRIQADDRAVIQRRFQNPSKIAFEARFRFLPPVRKAKNGKSPAIVHVQMTAAPLRDADGKLRAWRCLFTDVSRQVQAEELSQNRQGENAQTQEKLHRLQRQFERLKDSYFDLYHNAPVMYFSLDAQGQFVTFNDTLLRTLGFQREELLGRKYSEIVTRLDKTPVSFELPSDRQEEWETQWRRRDGSLLDVWLRTVAVFDEKGQFVRWRSCALDFTERNRLANELRAHTDELQHTNTRLRHINSELEDFTHVVSHDLKEPLRTLQAYSHLLAEDFSSQLSTDGFQYVNHLLQASQRLGQLIDNLLNLSHAGRATRAPKVFDLIEVVATVRRDLVDLIQRKEATILTEGALPTVVGDPQRITQLMTNLIANGLKYNKNSSPVVVIGQAARGGDERQAIIYVRDNGIGIDAKDHQQIFGLFRRVSTADEYEGTGAGLAICKKIVESHGGRIWVDSQLGAGATFYFTLPKPTVPSPSKNGRSSHQHPIPAPTVRPRTDVSGKHVLLVEDLPEVGAIIQKLAKRSGIDITWFTTAEDAWDWLQDARPDFLLLDINLPGMNGLELCRRIRQDLQSEVPIALFSQEQQPEEQDKLRELGADYFLSKDLLGQPAVWQKRLEELLAAAAAPIAIGS